MAGNSQVIRGVPGLMRNKGLHVVQIMIFRNTSKPSPDCAYFPQPKGITLIGGDSPRFKIAARGTF